MKRPLDVEPLPEARYARAERALFDRLAREGNATPPAKRDARWAFAAIAAAAVIAILVWRPWATRAPVVAAAPSPSHMVTEATSSHVTLGENDLDLGPETSLVSTGDDELGVVLVLESGSVTCHVAPRHGRPPFVVQAGDVRVTVKGTRFTVTRNGTAVSVSVESGVVDVNGDGTLTELTAGGRWPAATVDPMPTTTPTASIAPSSTAAASGVARPAPDAQARFEAAETLEATDPDAAIATYGALAKGSGPWAENALFAQGRLLAERGRKSDAEKVLRDYLARYPAGRNAGDARALLAQMH